MQLDRHELHVVREFEEHGFPVGRFVHEVNAKRAGVTYGFSSNGTVICTIRGEKVHGLGGALVAPNERKVVERYGRVISFARALMNLYNNANETSYRLTPGILAYLVNGR